MTVCVVVRCVEEAMLMKAFGLRVSGALGADLELWVALPDTAEQSWLTELAGLAVAEVRDFSGVDRRRQVLDSAKKEWPNLLVIGKQAGVKSEDLNLRFSTDIFEKAGCQVLVVRVSDDLATTGKRILVPCAGGRHSRRALKVAKTLSENGTVAFQVRPDADELSEELGHKHLNRIVKRAGLDRRDVLTRVCLG